MLFVECTVYPKKYAHGFVVICFVVVMQSFIMNSHEVFIHIHQGCFAGTGAIVRLPQCQWSKPGGYGKISQCITTTKHSKAKTVCIFLGIYCMADCLCSYLPPSWLLHCHSYILNIARKNFDHHGMQVEYYPIQSFYLSSLSPTLYKTDLGRYLSHCSLHKYSNFIGQMYKWNVFGTGLNLMPNSLTNDKLFYAAAKRLCI